MLETYVSVALICGASLLAGRAIIALSGREEWSWAEPAVGFAALMTVAGVGARLGAGGTTATILVIGLGVASVAGLALRFRGPSVSDAVLRGLPVAAVILLALSLPFVVNGRWGLIGVGFNNDLGLHLAWSEWLRSGFGPEPDAGYPLGPHGLAIAVAAFPRIGLGQAFVGEVISISVLTGLTALGALRSFGPVRATVAASFVTLSYLAASYFAQAAFKETAEALFVLAFAIYLPSVTPLPSGGRAIARVVAPLIVLCTGIFFSYSFAGLAWPVGIAGLWALTFPEFRAALHPRALLRRLATPATLGWAAGFALFVVFAAFVGPFAFSGGFGAVASSNTYGAVAPFEAFGVWPSSNYRLDGAGSTPYAEIAAAVGIIAFVVSLAWWLRRGERSIPIAVGACVILYLASLPSSGSYSQAKALMIASPLIALMIIRALLSAPGRTPAESDGPAAESSRRANPKAAPFRIAWAGFAAVFVAGAAYSSFLVLRETPIAPPGHGAELNAFRSELQGSDVLYGGQDRYAAYELQGADTAVPLVEFPEDEVEESATKPFDTGDAYSPIDFDSFNYFTLNHHKYLITGAASWNSQAFANFKQVARTPSFILWKARSKAFRNRRTAVEGTEAAAQMHCASPETQIFTATSGTASVFPDPVAFGQKTAWSNGAMLQTGESTSQTLQLPPGRYRLSIQYFSPVGMTLTAPGFEQDLIPALDGQRPDTISLANDGQYWPAGVYEQTGPGGPVEFTVAAAEPTGIQDIVGYDGISFIGHLVAVPEGPHEFVPLSETCGRWIDWYKGESAP